MLASCPNCTAALAGEYCPACGQRRIAPDDLSARRFFRDLIDEIAHLQVGRKALLTLLALLVPGKLTTEHIAGRRGTYLGPIKVYLLSAAIFFFAAPFVGFDLDTLIRRDPSGELATEVSAIAARQGVDVGVIADRFLPRLQSIYTLALTASTLVWALAMQLLFVSKRLPFGVHLTFAAHYSSIVYLITLITAVPLLFAAWPFWIQFAAMYALLAPYLFAALRRVYGLSAVSTLWRWAILLPLKIFVYDLADAAAVQLALRWV